MLPVRHLLPALAALALALALAGGVADAAARTPRRLPILNVVPTAAHGAASRSIGPAGGKLHVKTPNGTAVTLTIPRGALTQATTITLTPVARIKRFPFKKGLVAAVLVGPEGLRLGKAATLTFAPRKMVPLPLQTPFAAIGSGKSFHLYPGKRGRTVQSVPLFHFSTYGEGEATASERSGESHRQQSTPEATAENQMAGAGGESAELRALEPWMQWVDKEVRDATTNDAAVLSALEDALTLAETLRYHGWSSDVLPDIGDDFPKTPLGSRLRALANDIATYFPGKILDAALQRAKQRCISNNDPSQAEVILSIEEMRRLLGSTGEVQTAEVENCLTFELSVDADFVSGASNTGPGTVHTQYAGVEVHIHGELPVHLGLDGSVSGGGMLAYEISHPNDQGGNDTTEGSGAAAVTAAQWTQPTVDHALRVVIPLRVTSLTITAPMLIEHNDPRTFDYGSPAVWEYPHRPELTGGEGYLIGDWSAGGGNVFAQKAYNRTFYEYTPPSDWQWTENTTLKLLHTPSS